MITQNGLNYIVVDITELHLPRRANSTHGVVIAMAN